MNYNKQELSSTLSQFIGTSLFNIGLETISTFLGNPILIAILWIVVWRMVWNAVRTKPLFQVRGDVISLLQESIERNLEIIFDTFVCDISNSQVKCMIYSFNLNAKRDSYQKMPPSMK
jgi:hypothetical protein